MLPARYTTSAVLECRSSSSHTNWLKEIYCTREDNPRLSTICIALLTNAASTESDDYFFISSIIFRLSYLRASSRYLASVGTGSPLPRRDFDNWAYLLRAM